MVKIIILLVFVFTAVLDAKFSDWNGWSACSSFCGKGTKTRERVLKDDINGTCYSTIIEKRECQNNCRTLRNVALGKRATASSQFLNVYPAGMAIDGITRNSLNGKSCMHTAKDKKPWLRIDLKGNAVVEKVIIHNRADCCTERLNNLVIRIGNNATGVGNDVCGRQESMKNVEKLSVSCCNLLEGRYVHVTIPGPQFLHICEVEVMGNIISDLAYDKTAKQISTHSSPYVAGKALDRNTATYTHTTSTTKPWWRVDLGKNAYIRKVIVNGHSNYAKNADVTVEDGSSKHWCGDTGSVSSKVTVVCPKMLLGRYVRIQLRTTGHLLMYEVEVLGYYPE